MRMRSIKIGLACAMVCVAISTILLPGSVAMNENWKIEDLAWISGDWETTSGPLQIEEHWTRVAGGSMIGMGRTVAKGRTVFFEYLRIESRADGIYYVAHPKARPGTDFKLVRVEGQSATFENLAHDFPKRLIYRKNADGSLTTRVEGDGTEKEKPEEFRLRPMK